MLRHLRNEKFKIAQNYINSGQGRLVGEAMIKSVVVLAKELGDWAQIQDQYLNQI